jgi:integrase
MSAAMVWAEERKAYAEDPAGWNARVFGADPDEEGAGGTPESFIHDEADSIRAKHGPEAERRFLNVAYGDPPLDAHLEAHLREAAITPRAAQERRTAVRRVTEWRPGATLRSLGRKQAGQYVSDVLAHGDPKTGNKVLSNLSSYWAWLVKRGHVDDNPWAGQRLSERKRRNGEKERPFTDEEMRTLLYGAWPAGMRNRDRLHDAMRIAALSGMRIEEICRLTVGDCAGGVFDVRQAKTAAGVRKVPIHSDLGEVIERRTAGRAATEFLIAEIEKAKGERSMPVSKQFTRYRRSVGVDERGEGKRRALVNFHSFRRWFITKAEQAGQPPHIFEAIVGHKRQGMSLGVYSGGPSVEVQMRGCVEAVRLP